MYIMSLYESTAIIDLADGAKDSKMNLCENLEFWMSQLPSRLRSLPIIRLAIPGSHNTMTYTIEENNEIGPDEPDLVRFLGRYFSIIAKPVVFHWSVNQTDNVQSQLDGGIRYLDLRVATKAEDDKFYFLHGLYGSEITQPLQQVADWLANHTNEAIIIDFQHFYNFNDSNHRQLIDQIKRIFHGKLCPAYNKFEHITLHWLNSEGYQVILVYRNVYARNYHDLWPSGLWPTPWPDTVSSSKLIDFLNDGLQNRTREIGFVSQCLLTPNSWYVVRHLFRNLRYLSEKCRRVSLPWIEEHSPGSGGMNIVISDCVDFDNFLFSRMVIQRNAFLLRLDAYDSVALHIKA